LRALSEFLFGAINVQSHPGGEIRGAAASACFAVELTYRVTVDVPARFRNSKAVGAVFGLTPSKHQSGEIDKMGGISKCGDAVMRTALFEAAQSMLTRTIKWSWLKAWGMKIAKRRGMKRAIVAVARRMAVVMHRIWVDGTEFRWTREFVTAKLY
jgi:transposase